MLLPNLPRRGRASEEGQNRNISIKDIERLEEMEALTTAALDAVEALARWMRVPMMPTFIPNLRMLAPGGGSAKACIAMTRHALPSDSVWWPPWDCCPVRSEAKQHAQGDNSRELLLRARQYVLTAESALDGIIAELPKKELAAAAAKLVAQGT